ncbi:ribonuclease H-like domain-containing protein [Bacillus salitolerans]|uniref:Ribonuclease H-like domain-containing protein n=1 Tax=Bacillus salitolerans TaxID=1437434 RepID=A0ABW4LVG7_9BACI
MSLKAKLQRMKNHIVTDSTNSDLNGGDESNSKTIPYLKEWEQFGAKPYFFENEYIFIREAVYSLNVVHGLYSLGELVGVVQDWNHSTFEHPLSSKGFHASDLFFFDTETTGLGSGVGNTIFLLGYAQVFRDHVLVKQLFLPSPSSEVALYHYFLQDINFSTLVTYNGKAFDWPQVKTRHTLIRDLVPKLPKFGHFDLLHASRRLWKNEYDSLKLSVVEKDILNITRKDDIPGFMAPMIYMQYLDDSNPEGVFGVMAHNETDILTLISLYIHLSKKLLFSEASKSNERFEVARWLRTLGEEKEAQKVFEQLSSTDDMKIKWSSKMAMAMHWKKQNRYADSIQIWDEIHVSQEAQDTIRIQAAVELAKYYEHKEKDIDKALEITERAYTIWKEKFTTIRLSEEPHLEKRLSRLLQKLRK